MKTNIGHSEKDKDADLIRQMWPKWTLAKKAGYIVSYYGIAIAAAILAAGMIVFFARDFFKEKKEDAFCVMVLGMNLSEEDVLALEKELSKALGLDADTQQCRIESGYSGNGNLQSEAVISAYMRSGQVDLVIAPEEEFNRYAATGYLSPLAESGFPDIEEAMPKAAFYAELVDYSNAGRVTDIPFHPHEAAAGAKCYGLYLTGEPFGGYVAGIAVNCPNQERVRKGIEYLLELDEKSL